MKNKVLIVAAHPDDEILGVGGTAARHAESGDYVYCLILGEGVTARSEKRENGNKNDIKKLHESTLKAAKIIGIKEVFFSNIPDNRFDSVDLLDVVKEVEKVADKIKPNIVYTHHYGDLNVDHRITFEAVMTAFRPIKDLVEIYTFETPSSTEWNVQNKKTVFMPNFYVDISKTLKKKLNAMKEYSSEIHDYPHPRSLKALEILAGKRGVDSGLKTAEAFCLIRGYGR